MNVDIEFFSDDALENIATCLEYSIDKIIYIGYEEPMGTARRRNLAGLLKNVIGIEYVDFVQVERRDLSDIMDKLEDVVTTEREAGNHCYFDLTGGDDLILVAAGIIAERHGVTMHQIELDSGTLHEYSVTSRIRSISNIKKDKFILSASEYMKFRGTCINHKMHKGFKTHINNEDFVEDVKLLWEVCRRAGKNWNVYGKYFRNNTNEPINTVVSSPFSPGDDLSDVYHLLKMLEDIGALSELKKGRRSFRFRYKNKNIKDCLCDSGSILELYTYLTAVESGFFDSCDVGVHLDWDGTIDGWLPDVTNEVDVLLMKNNIPTFISCKNGRLDRNALYEIDTVAKKFGGKYAKKLVISSQNHDETLDERAREMGILLVDDEIFDWTSEEFTSFLTSIYDTSPNE